MRRRTKGHHGQGPLTSALVLAGIAAVAVSGCGSDSSNSSTSAGSSSAAEQAQSRQAELFKGEGYESPPTSSPPPQTGKNVWFFSCSLAVQSCKTPIDAAVEAGKKLGWSTTVYDVNFDPARFAEGLRQATAANADGIIMYSVDCQLAKGAVTSTRNAGVKLVAAESLQCPGSELYDYIDAYTQGPFPKWESDLGRAQATNLIAGTDGSPKIVALNQADIPSLIPVVQGFKAEVQDCGSSCEIVEQIDFTTPDLGPTLQQKIQQALLQHPDANALWLPYDMFSLGPDAALRASGRGDEVLVAIGEGQASTLDVLRDGRVNGVGVGIPQGWEGYHMVDSLNRLFAGETPQPSGMGLQAFDKTRNIPPSGPWVPPIDYKSVYLDAWGVAG